MSHKKNPPKNAAEVIQELASKGFSNIGIAKHFGVAKETVRRWLEEDESLQEAFEMGREVERQALHAAVYRSAMEGKPANVNAFFILKARFGYVEADHRSTNVNVGVSVTPSVLVVHSHGSDAEWEAKAVEHQRALVANAANPPKQIEATVEPAASVRSVESAPAWIPTHLAKATPQTTPEAPAWRGNA